MGAKKRQAAQAGSSTRSSAPPLPQKELIQRINFSYQASLYLQALGQPSSVSQPTSPELGKVEEEARGSHIDMAHPRPGFFERLAGSEVKGIGKVAKRNMLKL